MATRLTNVRARGAPPYDFTEWHYVLLSTGWYGKRWLASRAGALRTAWPLRDTRRRSRQEGRKSSPWPTYSLGPFPTREDAERALALALLEGRFV